MDPLVAGILFMLGAIVASFAGVVAGRWGTGESIVHGRSRCDACGETLTPIMLVPVVSYLVSRGRAQCCGARLSSYAPITEALLGTLFVLAYGTVGYTVALPLLLTALTLLLILVLYDLMHQILPPIFLGAFVFFAALVGYVSAPWSVFMQQLGIAVLLAGSLFAIHVFSKGRAMGLADAPLVFGLALLVGSVAFSGFIFSFWIGAVIGIMLLARRPRGSRMGVEVPFAPFLAAGFLLAYFTQWNPFALITMALYGA